MKRVNLAVLFACISISLFAQETADKQKLDDMLVVASTQKFPYTGKLRLEQNFPNPLVRSESTTIRYQATDVYDVCIAVYNDETKERVLTLSNLDQNIGQVKITGNQLPKGTYTYALLVNGRMVEKRKMVVVD
jgi:hypothetical protein